MKYKISTIDVKTTTTGKTKADVELIDEQGQTIPATIWSEFPDFNTITFGSFVEGDLVPSKDPKYRPSLNPVKQLNSQPRAPQRATGAIKQAMEVKAQNIATAQTNKELGIMTSSTIRMACDIAIAEQANQMWDTGVFKGRVKFWRDWLISEWDSVGSAPPFN